jgi:protein-tyrosine phosphatase
MARPRGGDWLADELHALANTGTDILVSLLTDAELIELDLGDEESLAAATGLEFHRLPTPDRDVPQRQATLILAETLSQRLNEGAGIAVHCRNGIGRSSTLAVAVLLHQGVGAREAFQRIAQARGLPVPDTQAQQNFITSLHETRTPADPIHP